MQFRLKDCCLACGACELWVCVALVHLRNLQPAIAVETGGGPRQCSGSGKRTGMHDPMSFRKVGLSNGSDSNA